jgi:hypothetical protein
MFLRSCFRTTPLGLITFIIRKVCLSWTGKDEGVKRSERSSNVEVCNAWSQIQSHSYFATDGRSVSQPVSESISQPASQSVSQSVLEFSPSGTHDQILVVVKTVHFEIFKIFSFDFLLLLLFCILNTECLRTHQACQLRFCTAGYA